MKRTLSLVLACVCLLAILIADCNADCGGRFGKRIQSGLSRVAGVSAKIKQVFQSRSANCSMSVPAASSCSMPVMSCFTPQVSPVALIEPTSVPLVVSVSATILEQSPELEPVMQCASGSCTVQDTSRAFQPIRNSIAQYKAEVQARNGRMQHIGGSFGAGRFEGVGFSTVSADAAIKACCYYGEKTPVDIGVARGNNGWYATVLYR